MHVSALTCTIVRVHTLVAWLLFVVVVVAHEADQHIIKKTKRENWKELRGE